MQCCCACMQGGGNHAENSAAKKKRGQHPAAPQTDGTEKDLSLGPRDVPTGQGQHGRRHRGEGRGQEGSDPC